MNELLPGFMDPCKNPRIDQPTNKSSQSSNKNMFFATRHKTSSTDTSNYAKKNSWNRFCFHNCLSVDLMGVEPFSVGALRLPFSYRRESIKPIVEHMGLEPMSASYSEPTILRDLLHCLYSTRAPVEGLSREFPVVSWPFLPQASWMALFGCCVHLSVRTEP